MRSVGLGLVLTIGAMGVGAGAAQGDAAPPSGPHARGLEAYRTNYCGACHVLAVAGTAGTFGPSHDGMAATAAERLRDPAYGGAAATPAEYLRESIVDPAAFLAPGYVHSAHAMPAFLHLPDEDLDALVTLLLAQ